MHITGAILQARTFAYISHEPSVRGAIQSGVQDTTKHNHWLGFSRGHTEK
jgi:hypothetical protein